ncbi:MAG: GNAT family N-acetyltransferase [Actinomycetota bacterium]
MTVTVRTARRSDADAMGRVHVESWQAAYVGIVSQTHLDGLDSNQRAENWREAISATPNPTHGRRLVAELSGEVVGIALVVPDRSGTDATGEIPILYVHPTAWGAGVGYALLAECEAELVRRGFESGLLWVLADNERARRFYERQGWTADGGEQRDSIGGIELTEVRYRKALR